jgi:hypothetical protein
MAFTGSAAALSHLTPRPTKSLDQSNYLSFADANFWDQQYLPEVYEKEIERYGKRTVGGFLRMVGAEMPMASDRVIWSEQGRLHISFDDCTVGSGSTTVTFTNTAGGDTGVVKANLLAPGMTIVISNALSTGVVKARVATSPGDGTITVTPYGAANLNAVTGTGNVKVFVYGSEFAKGSADGGLSKEASFTTFSNKPIILRDKYSVAGSDVAQIGWIEVTTEAGTGGYLWYLKSEHESRLRFEDHLEMAMVEGELDEGTLSGSAGAAGYSGTQGLFSAINSRGLVYGGTDFGGANGLDQFDEILAELDKQGAIEENMLFLDRATSLGMDNMLAAQNSYGAGGTSYGVFDNSEDMALNLGFSGFRRGSYDFYKTDWKYLNDATTRGLIGDIEGVLAPAGTSTVYDEQMGKNVSRPFLHVRYRANEADDRRMKSWITGSVGGNYTSAADEMNVHFLSERALCVQAANNFVLLKK